MADMITKWLHLSDIHFLFSNYPTDFMRRDFIAKLKSHSDLEPFTFIFVTGDITNQNGGYPDTLIKFIEELLMALNVDKSRLFIVPGNHDMDYKLVDQKLIEDLKTPGKNPQKIIEGYNKEAIKKILLTQSKYFEFYKVIKGVEYPVDSIHFSETFKNVNIIHLNTSWLNGISGNEGNIYIGINKLYEELVRLSPQTNQLNIIIGHHSLDCFAPNEREHLKSIFKAFNTDFYLSGHLHEAFVNYDSYIDTHFCVCRHMRDDGLPGGYAIGKIDDEYGDNYIEFRTWNNERGYWTIDNNVGHSAPEGRYNVNSAKFPTAVKGTPFVAIHKTMTGPESPSKLLEEMGFGKVNYRRYPFSNLSIDDQKVWLEHKEHTYHFAVEILNQLNDEVLHIFPLSQIPLLIYFGYLLQDDNKICVYQKNEEQDWVLANTEAQELDIKCEKLNMATGSRRLIVIVEASAKVNDVDINVHISTKDNDVIRISLDNPERYTVLYESQVKAYKNLVRRSLEPYANKYDEIHLFAAVPAGLAVALGRIVMKSMWPKVFLYNYRFMDNPRYQYTFTINE